MDTPPVAATAAPEQDDPTIWRVDDALGALIGPILACPNDDQSPVGPAATTGPSSTA